MISHGWSTWVILTDILDERLLKQSELVINLKHQFLRLVATSYLVSIAEASERKIVAKIVFEVC